MIDTRNDPRHYTKRDGRIRPVGGTHEDGEQCATCEAGREPLRVLASSFGIGALVTWPYGRTGAAHGRVIAQGRTRVQVFWHSRRARGVWIAASRLRAVTNRAAFREAYKGCAHCADGR